MKPDNIKRRKGQRRPANYYRDWERKKKLKAKHFKANLKKVKKWVNKNMKGVLGSPCLCAALMLWVMMKRYGFSLRGMVGELYFRPGACKIVGLDWYPSKSWLHKWLGRLPLDVLDKLILLTAGKDAFGTLSVDSSHHRFNRYVLTENAKHGKVWAHDTVKHHALISPNGKVVASVVTKGTTGDSPILEQLCAKISKGSGYFLGDAAYCSENNCMIAKSVGRDPCFPPKSNYLGKGMGPWADMIRWRKEHPGTFYKVYGQRNTVESCFGAIKGRFVYCVRSVTLEMQKRELAVVSICRNIYA